jgi:HAD superfamily phosphoserine phosphatase-like hydrolase
MSRSVVVDFDGTVTERDTLRMVLAEFGERAVVDEADAQLHRGAISLREEITTQFSSVRAPLDEVVGWVVENATVRPGFREFAREFRPLLVSSGFHELIEPVLEREGVEVELHANRLDPRLDGWRVDWRYPADCEVCGESCKRSLLPAGYVVYVGDGYSDRCAALAADRVFATAGLARYLSDRGVGFEPFADFHDLSQALAD